MLLEKSHYSILPRARKLPKIIGGVCAKTRKSTNPYLVRLEDIAALIRFDEGQERFWRVRHPTGELDRMQWMESREILDRASKQVGPISRILPRECVTYCQGCQGRSNTTGALLIIAAFSCYAN